MRCEGCFREISNYVQYCPYCGEKVELKADNNKSSKDNVYFVKSNNNQANNDGVYFVKSNNYQNNNDGNYPVNGDNNQTNNENKENVNNNISENYNYFNQQNPTYNPADQTNKNNATQALVFGIISLVLGFMFVEPFIIIISLILGILAIIYGIKAKKFLPTRSMFAIVLGGLGLVLVVSHGLTYLREYMEANKLSDRYSEELNIEIPKITPFEYHFFEKNFMSEFGGIEVAYEFSDSQMSEFINKMDDRWNSTPFSPEIHSLFTSMGFTMNDVPGYYLVYDYLDDVYYAPDNLNEVHFVIIFLSTEDNVLWILEAWN